LLLLLAGVSIAWMPPADHSAPVRRPLLPEKPPPIPNGDDASVLFWFQLLVRFVFLAFVAFLFCTAAPSCGWLLFIFLTLQLAFHTKSENCKT